MRPSRYARNWDCRHLIRRPLHVTTLVSGRSVTSTLRGFASTSPTRTLEWILLTGQSGWVILVGWEKDGTVRPTRRASGAGRGGVSGLSAPSAGCGMVRAAAAGGRGCAAATPRAAADERPSSTDPTPRIARAARGRE